jgi:hypothetical protein
VAGEPNPTGSITGGGAEPAGADGSGTGISPDAIGIGGRAVGSSMTGVGAAMLVRVVIGSTARGELTASWVLDTFAGTALLSGPLLGWPWVPWVAGMTPFVVVGGGNAGPPAAGGEAPVIIGAGARFPTGEMVAAGWVVIAGLVPPSAGEVMVVAGAVG